MIQARTHDQTVAEDYFGSEKRVEQRLDIVPEPKQDTEDKLVRYVDSLNNWRSLNFATKNG